MPQGIGNPHGYPDYTWPMVWVLQDGELWPIEQWVAKQGVQKAWQVDWTETPGAQTPQALYTVPSGKIIYATHYFSSSTEDGWHWFQYVSPTVITYKGRVAALTPVVVRYAPPIVVPAGKTIRVSILNSGAVNAYNSATVLAYELDS